MNAPPVSSAFEESLLPLRKWLTDDEVRSLTLAIRSAIGIEALVWLTGIGGLTRDRAVASMRWSAQALLQQALVSGPPSGVPSGAQESA